MLNLQTLVVAPRDDRNARSAKLDESRLSTGRDGVLYKMSDSRDWKKYYTLSDEDLQQEKRKSLEVQQNMMALGRSALGGTNRQKMKAGIKMVAPQFGTNSRERRIETRQWTKDLTQSGLGGSTRAVDGRYRDTMTQLQQNTRGLQRPEDDEEEFEFAVDTTPPAGADKVSQVFRVIQQKYEQNLHVIDKLCDERVSLEEYTRSLERKLMEVTGRPVDVLGGLGGESPLGDRDRSPRTPAGERASFDELSALEAADAIQGPQRSEDPALVRGRQRHRDRTPMVRSQSLNPTRQRSASAPRRSLSASRSSVGISPHLQADIDHFVQKRRVLEEKERLAALETEEEERRRQQRFQKASFKGRAFSEMEERQRLWEEERERRLAGARRAEREKELEARRAREDRRKREGQLMATAVRGSMSWQEMQDTLEAKRRESIEAHKQELLGMSALPASLAESLQRVKRAPAEVPQPDFRPRIRSEEPEVVARRLARSQQAWTQRLSHTKEKMREQFLAQRALSASGLTTQSVDTARMEARAAQCKARRDSRLEAQRDREQRERQTRERAERDRAEKLLGSKLPESSLKATKAAKMREDKIKTELLERELEEGRERRLRERQGLKLKEAAAALQSVIRERDEDLRARNPSARLEVSEAEAESKERAARAREEYRAKLRENKQKIRDALKSRPSLMERHDQSVANRTAATQALRTLTQAFTAGENDEMDDLEAMLDGKSKAATRKGSAQGGRSVNGVIDALLEGDDVFDTKEKVIVKSILGK